MNRQSNRHPSWSWLPVACSCCGLFFVGIAEREAIAQEKPNFGPFDTRESDVLSPAYQRAVQRRPLTLVSQVETPSPATAQPVVPQPVAAPEFLPRLSAKEQRILVALGEPTEVAFNDNPLEEALNYLKDLHGIEIWIDKSALSADGVNTDQQVNLNLSGIALRSVLRLLLEPLRLTYCIEDEVLKITSQTAANKTIVTRTYPVGDLFATREEAEELVESLTCGLGLTQKSKEEQKPLAVSVPAGAIIARLSRSQNDQLLQLLRDLREAKALVPERSYELVEPSRIRTRSLSPTPLDEFSPGSESRVLTPRLRVHGKPELSKPIETPTSLKATPDR